MANKGIKTRDTKSVKNGKRVHCITFKLTAAEHRKTHIKDFLWVINKSLPYRLRTGRSGIIDFETRQGPNQNKNRSEANNKNTLSRIQLE